MKAKVIAVLLLMIVGIVAVAQIANAGVLSCMKYDGARFFECLAGGES